MKGATSPREAHDPKIVNIYVIEATLKPLLSPTSSADR